MEGTSIRREFGRESDGEVPIGSYVQCFRHYASNSIGKGNGRFLNGRVDRIFGELNGDDDVDPLHQMEFAVIVGNFMQEELVRKWPLYKNDQNADDGDYDALCKLYNGKYVKQLSGLVKRAKVKAMEGTDRIIGGGADLQA